MALLCKSLARHHFPLRRAGVVLERRTLIVSPVSSSGQRQPKFDVHQWKSYDMLSSMPLRTLEYLKTMCKKSGLDTRGSKQQLMHRILDASLAEEAGEDEENVSLAAADEEHEETQTELFRDEKQEAIRQVLHWHTLNNDELTFLCMQQGLESTGKKRDLFERLRKAGPDGFTNKVKVEETTYEEQTRFYKKMTVKQLNFLCEMRGIKTGGRKADLIERLISTAAGKTNKVKVEETTYEEETRFYKQMTVKQLNSLCKMRGIKTAGRKADLIERLISTAAGWKAIDADVDAASQKSSDVTDRNQINDDSQGVGLDQKEDAKRQEDEKDGIDQKGDIKDAGNPKDKKKDDVDEKEDTKDAVGKSEDEADVSKNTEKVLQGREYLETFDEFELMDLAIQLNLNADGTKEELINRVIDYTGEEGIRQATEEDEKADQEKAEKEAEAARKAEEEKAARFAEEEEKAAKMREVKKREEKPLENKRIDRMKSEKEVRDYCVARGLSNEVTKQVLKGWFRTTKARM